MKNPPIKPSGLVPDFNTSRRRARLRKTIGAIPALLVNPVNRFYYTGFWSSAGYLINAGRASRLLLDGRYVEAARKLASRDLRVELLKKPADLAETMTKIRSRTWYLEDDLLSHAMVRGLMAKAGIKKTMPLKELIRESRRVKDDTELDAIRDSVRLAGRVYAALKRLAVVGVSEQELARKIKILTLKQGAEPGFEPIVAFGVNTSCPHHAAGPAMLRREMPVTIDFGVCRNRYHCDITRSFWFGRKPGKLYSRIHTLVAHIKNSSADLVSATHTFKAVQDRAMELCGAFRDQFLHSLGHSLGLEVHEDPSFRDDIRFCRGAVFTIEPGLYFAGKFGVRLEDTYWFDGRHAVNLTDRVC